VNRGLWGASVGQSILLFVSVAAAAGAGASFALLRPGRRLYRAILPMLLVGGLWFIISWIVFFAAALGHCPIGPFGA
jgi:hypothetical protein